MSGTIEPTNEEFQAWVHAVQHAIWRRTGLPVSEASLTSECWLGQHPPLWAIRASDAGEPGERWCPQLDSTLWTRPDEIEDELALLLG